MLLTLLEEHKDLLLTFLGAFLGAAFGYFFNLWHEQRKAEESYEKLLLTSKKIRKDREQYLEILKIPMAEICRSGFHRETSPEILAKSIKAINKTEIRPIKDIYEFEHLYTGASIKLTAWQKTQCRLIIHHQNEINDLFLIIRNIDPPLRH